MASSRIEICGRYTILKWPAPNFFPNPEPGTVKTPVE
jgi:hypothetical protein